jgi:hypothetical protein
MRVQAKGGMHRFGHAAGPAKRLENEYELGEEIRHGKFGSVHAYRAWASDEEFTWKALPKNCGDKAHHEVAVMHHLSGHSGVVTLRVGFKDADIFLLDRS